jgi:hypothetical protein
MVRSISEGQLPDLRPLLANLKAGRAKQHVFDDATIDRVIRVHTETLAFLPFTRRQLDRWETEYRKGTANTRRRACLNHKAAPPGRLRDTCQMMLEQHSL